MQTPHNALPREFDALTHWMKNNDIKNTSMLRNKCVLLNVFYKCLSVCLLALGFDLESEVVFLQLRYMSSLAADDWVNARCTNINVLYLNTIKMHHHACKWVRDVSSLQFAAEVQFGRLRQTNANWLLNGMRSQYTFSNQLETTFNVKTGNFKLSLYHSYNNHNNFKNMLLRLNTFISNPEQRFFCFFFPHCQCKLYTHLTNSNRFSLILHFFLFLPMSTFKAAHRQVQLSGLALSCIFMFIYVHSIIWSVCLRDVKMIEVSWCSRIG